MLELIEPTMPSMHVAKSDDTEAQQPESSASGRDLSMPIKSMCPCELEPHASASPRHAGPKRRGRKAGGAADVSRDSDDDGEVGPLIQKVDTAYLEELKAQAALEEQAIKEGRVDEEADPRRINFHRFVCKFSWRRILAL